MLTKILTVATLAVALNGCGGEASTPIVGLSAPAGAALITNNSGTDSSRTSNVSSASRSAFSNSGTDYSNATARSQVDIGPAAQPMKLADIILCILNKTAMSAIVNGKYLAVLDVNLCNNRGRDVPFMANMTVDTSRTSNTSNQITKTLYEYQSNGPKFTRFDSVVKKEPTLSSPYGELEFNWAVRTSVEADDVIHGSLAITDIGNAVSIELTEEIDCRSGLGPCNGEPDDSSTPYNENNYLSYIDASVSSDGTSGMSKVAYVDNLDPNKKLTYLLNWNNDFIAQYDYDTNDQLLQSSCKSRDSFLKSVSNYTLYNVDGSRLNVTPHVYGHYGTSSNQKSIYVSKRNAWFEGGETGDDRPTSMTTRDGTSLSISYDTGDSGNYDSDNDGTFATIIGVTLSDPIRFQDVVISGSNIVYNDGTAEETPYTADHMGSDGKHFWGIPRSTISGNYVAELNIKDGTQLTDVTGVNYILKQSLILKVPDTVNSSNCTTLTAAAVNAETNITAKTSADITAIDSSWVTPIVGDNPRVIDGVIQ